MLLQTVKRSLGLGSATHVVELDPSWSKIREALLGLKVDTVHLKPGCSVRVELHPNTWVQLLHREGDHPQGEELEVFLFLPGTLYKKRPLITAISGGVQRRFSDNPYSSRDNRVCVGHGWLTFSVERQDM